MAQQTINVGTSPNDGTGTPLRTAFQYTNSNFSELYTAVGPSGNNIVVPGSATISGDLTVDTSTLKVDSTNNRVGIGTASPTVPLYVTGNNATATAIMQDETNGAKLRLLANSINFDLSNGGGGGDIAVSGANPLTFRTNGTERARIDSSGNVGVGVTPAGTGGCLQLKSGITFPATQVASSDANTLDDYEEGTFTPTIGASSGTATTVTINSAIYTKIGREVTVIFDFSIVAVGTATGAFQFSLPFNQSASSVSCGAFRENGTTGNMGQVFYNTASDVSCFLYNNATVWNNGYRLRGTYTYSV